ncbi:MAG: hypothetical protein HYS13_16340 [Planctomycetia bacterium]|nr:hypothetical protein [Planctomycetia bacterium]
MLTVEDFGQIRRAHRDGESIRSIAKRLHHCRRKVREAIARPEPWPYTRSQPPPAPKLGPFHGLIDQILAEDEQAPRKQRHTATQIFRRLLPHLRDERRKLRLPRVSMKAKKGVKERPAGKAASSPDNPQS